MPSRVSSARFQQYKPSKLIDYFNLKNYVVFDVETTGLSSKTEEIGQQTSTFTSLVNPGKTLPSKIVSLTGLTDEMLKNAPVFSDIAKDVKQFMDGFIVLAHNATYDLGFLNEAFSKCGIKSNLQYLDTIKVAKLAYPGLKNYKLETLISELNLAEKQLHRAMADVQFTLKLYQLACEKFGNPLVRAISACCSPIEDYHLSYKSEPLKGLRVALLGTLTCSHSAAKDLIIAAGGAVVDSKVSNIDYLVYGVTEPGSITPEHEASIRNAIVYGQKGDKPKYINEIGLLKLCGVTFFDED